MEQLYKCVDMTMRLMTDLQIEVIRRFLELRKNKETDLSELIRMIRLHHSLYQLREELKEIVDEIANSYFKISE